MKRHSRSQNANGQSVIELALIMPLLLVLVLGVVEVSYAVLDQHVVTRLTREGSNLISRDTSLQDTALALRDMASRPVDLSKGSRLILSVVKKGATPGTNNYNKEFLYQRYEYGPLSASSGLKTKGSGVFGGAPNYQAANGDTDTRLQLTNLPAGLVTTGGFLYVTEIFTAHPLITPFDRFGVAMPTTLYSIAYF